ncbi:uncharacterized protein [Bemisia tabaci]|uniref:uncharacterized protein n=1 Tax=Bemisia tabaci TaxID=7038 RepID=UPI0008F990DA|nr:PREDICTED: uncharacterized protein LOC109030503 [Bemisia tabaci]XP_018897054.1 PREDICTED: uncharacterized protein LOC109030503 [Bemisia tabaci]
MPKRTYKSQGGSSSKKYKKRLTSISQIVDISKSNTSVRGVIQSLSGLKESDAGNEYFHFYLHDSNGKIYCFGFCEKQHKKLREGMSVELTNFCIQTSKFTGKTEIKLTDESTVRKIKTIDVTIPENWTKIEDIFAMDGDSLIDFKGQCSETPKKDKKKITFMATDTDSTKSSIQIYAWLTDLNVPKIQNIQETNNFTLKDVLVRTSMGEKVLQIIATTIIQVGETSK